MRAIELLGTEVAPIVRKETVARAIAPRDAEVPRKGVI
jgi:hypothetical protein